MQERSQSAGEELANSISHGIGFLVTLVAVPILILATIRQGNAESIIGAAIFSATMLLLYFTSALYHALPHSTAKQVLLRFDNAAIYLFIAGSYTPFALGAPFGARGWMLFGLVWVLALVGAVLKAFDRPSHPVLSTGLYLAMGWLVLIAAWPLAARLPASGLFWLVSGGVAYTVGVVFFAASQRLRYSHLIWHLFVMTGTTCHFLAVAANAA